VFIVRLLIHLAPLPATPGMIADSFVDSDNHVY
jgi:hypothetical protein